jgi:hypothetical protein
MRPLTAALGAMIMFATACGSDAGEVLQDLGLSDTEANCFTTEYEARDLDLDRVLRSDDGELSEAEQQAVIEVASICLGVGADNTDPDDPDPPDTDDTDDTADSDDSGATDDTADSDDSGATDDTNDPSPSSSVPIAEGVTYGDNPEMDLLWDMCELGDGEACDELYFISPDDSGYEEFGDTCGFRFEPDTVLCAAELTSSTGGAAYGDDPVLDSLYDACAAGDMLSCDTLWLESPVDSEYESYGSTCGGGEADTFGGCAAEPMLYGDDAYFDGLYDACGAGDMASCDTLYLESPVESEYETFGSLCGGVATEDEFGACEAFYS